MQRYIFFICLALTFGCTSETEEVDHSHHEHHEHHEGHEIEPSVFEVTGVVIDTADRPVAEAMVLQGGRPETTVLTGEDGTFSIMFEEPLYGMPSLVASKAGYRASGSDTVSEDFPVKIKIQALDGPDNEEYIYQEPGDGIDDMKEDCTHCHKTFVEQFLSSKHATAAQDPRLHDLYAGISRAFTTEESCVAAGGNWKEGREPGSTDISSMKCYLGGGVLPDLNSNCGGTGQPACDSLTLSAEQEPTEFGACADCHAPGINGKAGGRNLHDATGLAYEKGIHCDVCHKVSDIDMSQPPGVGHRLVMGRPSEQGRTFFEWDPVYYGPFLDVPNPVMGGSQQTKFKEALFCAGCHEQDQQALLPGNELDSQRWPNGLPVQSTYSEWQSGPYNQAATPCQYCHMPSTYGRINAVDTSTLDNQSSTHGFLRDPDDHRQHIFRGPLVGSPRLIDEALYVSIKTTTEEQTLSATVSITNIGCGHAVPTGEPMRALVMIVEASGEGCDDITANGGMTVQDTGGALAQGSIGPELTLEGTTLTWAAGVTQAAVGQVIRIVRPTGAFDDYPGVGHFGNAELGPQDKGLEILSPIGEARIEAIQGNELTLNKTLSAQSGDIVYLGDPWSASPADGQDSLNLSGMAGYTFAKVLLDKEGNRHVPHYKAVDIESDNRIGPGISARTTHTFSLPTGCATGEVRARVLYRPVPVEMGALRGWETKDYLIAEGSQPF